MNESEVQNTISILKSPKFWQIKATNDDKVNSWTNSFKGRIQWGYMYNSECKFCKNKDECKHRTACKLYTIVNDEGNDVVTIKRVNVNAKLPVQGTSGAAGYDLSAAQAVVVPTHG